MALAYSSVGLGGGSSYTSLLAIFGFSAAVIPMVSLTLNLLVTSTASYTLQMNQLAKAELLVLDDWEILRIAAAQPTNLTGWLRTDTH